MEVKKWAAVTMFIENQISFSLGSGVGAVRRVSRAGF